MKRFRLASVFAAFILLAILVTWSVAQGQSTETYYACVNNASGTIHMVSAGEGCANNEVLVEWNQAGPAGPAGPQGEPGGQGGPGDPGPPGASWYEAEVYVTTYEFYPGYTDPFTFDVGCPEGETLLSAGWEQPASLPGFFVHENSPRVIDGELRWRLRGTNYDAKINQFVVRVMCARQPSP